MRVAGRAGWPCCAGTSCPTSRPSPRDESRRPPSTASCRGRTGARARPGRRARAGRRPAARSRWPPPAATTCSCRARPARARRCWPSGCPVCCPTSTSDEALEVTAIHSVAGLLPAQAPLVRRPPFCRRRTTPPRCRRSLVAARPDGPAGSGVAGPPRGAVPGRGARVQTRGAGRAAPAARARRGRRSRAAAGTARFPARFQLVMAANPCPCGRAYGKGLYCTCTPQAGAVTSTAVRTDQGPRSTSCSSSSRSPGRRWSPTRVWS